MTNIFISMARCFGTVPAICMVYNERNENDDISGDCWDRINVRVGNHAGCGPLKVKIGRSLTIEYRQCRGAWRGKVTTQGLCGIVALGGYHGSIHSKKRKTRI